MSKILHSIWMFLLSVAMVGQNLVPNPSFEDMEDCGLVFPELFCNQHWAAYLDFGNTPDLGYEGALFFPPSTIDAFDGNQYLNIECSTGNPEYIQVQLLQPMEAGTTYCVSFYASVTMESTEVAPSLGAYFTHEPITDSPFELGIAASVQGPVEFDPTAWTLVSGTFVAQGGEDIMVLSGFENVGTMPSPYMYIDMVSVVAMPELQLSSDDLCNGPVVLDVSEPGATYTWSTGHTGPSIEVDAPGSVTVVRTIGVCAQQTTVQVTACAEQPDDTGDPDDPIDPVDPIDPDDGTDPDNGTDPTVPELIALGDVVFYVPNTFTPDGDGRNDVFGAIGPVTDQFELQIFSRWGELVYETNDIQQRWTGNHLNGSFFVPDGVYVYVLIASHQQQTLQHTGHVVLLR